MFRCGPVSGLIVSASLLIVIGTSAGAVTADELAIPAPERLALYPGDAPIGDGEFDPAKPMITLHRSAPANSNGAAMVICPGGGYGGLVVGAEGHGIANWLGKHGITGIVLEYRLPKGRAFVPLLDAQRAIRTARANAKHWNINPDRIGIIGFSAGGHLASTAGTHFDTGDPNAKDLINLVSCRPDFMVLVYPVITATGHRGTFTNLLGKNAKPEMLKLFSNETQVTHQTPPAFLAHALDDKVVSADANSKVFYEALKMHEVPADYLELPHGGHGLNGYKGPMRDAWQTQSLQFLAAQGIITQKDASGAGQ